MRRAILGAAAALFLLAVAAAQAAADTQDFDKRGFAYSQAPADAPGFDYYVLALSWAPTFCASHPADRAECGARRGFVAHGLWPQYAAGGGPEHCTSVAELDPQTIERAKDAIPDERLIRHEWAAHGTCSGLPPRDYFLTLIRALGRLSIPAEFDGQAPHSMTASQIVAAFVKANPKLPSSSLALSCRWSQLEEVRVCLSPQLDPRPCGSDVRTHCRSGPFTIGTMR